VVEDQQLKISVVNGQPPEESSKFDPLWL